MNFNERIAEYGKNIEEALENAINIPSLAQKEIFEAMSYSLNGGGKRIRPMLLLEFARVSGANNEAEIMPFACAIEMVHTYSLIHDDLPCMDDDELRRGRATNHIVFGEAIAVLAGDGLLNYAYEFMIKNSCFSADVTLTAVKALADAAGVYGMLGGQVIDMDGEGRALDATEITNLHRLKTGALIRAACEIGCILGGGDAIKRRAACEYADKIGLAFQMKDDILNVEGDPQKLGKSTGGDVQSGKSTFASLKGLDACKKEIMRLTDDAIHALGAFDDSEFLEKFASHLALREY